MAVPVEVAAICAELTNDQRCMLLVLEGVEADFYGVADNCFMLDGIVFEAIEDPSDGYRSSLDHVRRIYDDKLPFPKQPLARIHIEHFHGREKAHPDQEEDDWNLRERNAWKFVDVADGHCWLVIGTDNTDDYYPSFMFRYNPKQG